MLSWSSDKSHNWQIIHIIRISLHWAYVVQGRHTQIFTRWLMQSHALFIFNQTPPSYLERVLIQTYRICWQDTKSSIITNWNITFTFYLAKNQKISHANICLKSNLLCHSLKLDNKLIRVSNDILIVGYKYLRILRYLSLLTYIVQPLFVIIPSSKYSAMNNYQSFLISMPQIRI